MDFDTKQAKETVAQTAALIGDLVVESIKKQDGMNMGDIEQGMRQLLQEIGREAIGQVLEKRDTVQPSIRCSCHHKATYRCRREGMVITVFGRVKYKRSYYLCDHCRCGHKPLDTLLEIKPGEMSQGLKPLLALLGIQTSFDEAAKLAQTLLLVDISDNSIRQAVQWVGQKQVARETKWEKLSDWHHLDKQKERRDVCMAR